MSALMEVLARLLSFRAGGEAMPYAPRLLAVLLCAMFVFEVALRTLVDVMPTPPFWIAVRVGVGQALLWLVLKGADKRERFVQTSIALTLLTLVGTTIALPFVLPLAPLFQKPLVQETLPIAQFTMLLLLLPIMIWFIALQVSILREATEYRWLRAFLLTLMLPLTEAVIASFLMRVFDNASA